MKIALIVTLTAAAFFQPAVAQPGRGSGGERRGPPPPARQLEALNLTIEQQEEVELILQSQHQQMRALRDSDAPCEDRQIVRAAVDEELQLVLTAEQFSALKEQQQPPRGRSRNDDSCVQEQSQ